jgi:hypothetical protein
MSDKKEKSKIVQIQKGYFSFETVVWLSQNIARI